MLANMANMAKPFEDCHLIETADETVDETADETVDEAADEAAAEQECEGLPWLSILMLVAGAVICWGTSLFLPELPAIARAASWDNWINFGQRIAHDTLQAVAILFLAVAVSTLFPRIGLWIEGVVFRSRRRSFLVVAAGLAILTSGLFNYFILDHMPHIQDEIAMEFQAKILASGRLYAPAPPLPEFFDCEFIIHDGSRWYGKYFLGQSLPMVPGVWLNATWLIHPILAGVAIWLTYLLGKELFNDKIARVAAVLMVISPFRISLFAMTMAHPVPLVMLAVVGLGMTKVVLDPRRSGWAFAAGAALGFAGNARPLTALAIGSVMFLAAMLAMPWRRFRWQTGTAFVLGVGVFALVFLGYNKLLTGDALLTPFSQWSSSDRLGFGLDVGLEYWRGQDKGHTLTKALFKDTYFNLDVLGQNLTGWGRVVLLLLIWPLIHSRWPKRSWILVMVIAVVVVAHFFHVSSGVLAGQARYWSEAMPMLMLLLAIGLASVRAGLPVFCRWLGLTPAVRTGRAACWLAGAMLILWSGKIAYWQLMDECSGQFWGQGPSLRELARKENLDNALVFVESSHYGNHFTDGTVDVYPCGFMLNDPDLRGPVVYARDLGDERNAELMALYPKRSFFRVDPSNDEDVRFISISRSASRPAR